MNTIYFKSHPKRQAEKIFFNHLKTVFPDFVHIEENYKLDPQYIEQLISKSEVLDFINRSKFISSKKKSIAFDFFSKLPTKVKVAKDMSELSVDFVIKNGDQLTFIEFHEKQHCKLSDYRLRPIYSNENERFEVPRYLSRLMKDIWRWKNLSNYKIVWFNWFGENSDSPIKFQNDGNEEFCLPNKFAFSTSETSILD